MRKSARWTEKLDDGWTDAGTSQLFAMATDQFDFVLDQSVS